jgi:hypothetical protein
MTTTAMPLAELTRSAIHLLCQEIGIVNTARFLNQFTLGYGDYTEDREELFGQLTVNNIAAEIKRTRPQQPNQE